MELFLPKVVFELGTQGILSARNWGNWFHQINTQVLYILKSVWVLRTLNAGRNSHFPKDDPKKIVIRNFSYNQRTQNNRQKVGGCLEKKLFLGNKILNQGFGSNLKNLFFCKILPQICYFFEFFQHFSTRNTDNDYFAALKRWLNYTTNK